MKWDETGDHFDSGQVMMDHTRWIQFNSLRIQLAEAPGEHGIVDKLRFWSRADFDLLPRASFASLGTSTEDFCSEKVIPISSKEMWFKQEQSRDWRERFWWKKKKGWISEYAFDRFSHTMSFYDSYCEALWSVFMFTLHWRFLGSQRLVYQFLIHKAQLAIFGFRQVHKTLWASIFSH